MKYLIIGILTLIFALGVNFLISWGAVALAASCFGFVFAWKYVWFVLSFVLTYFRSNKKGRYNAGRSA